jgi:hypothetical protein
MTDAFFHQVKQMFDEKLKKEKAERRPDVFAVFLRDGEGDELEFQPWVYQEMEQRAGIQEGWTDHETEFAFRSHPVLWEIYTEFNYTADHQGRELLLPISERYEEKSYELRVEDTIPIALKPYTRILDFKGWGERLYFDFDCMKSDATRTFLETGDVSGLQIQLETIRMLETAHPNVLKKDYEAKCVRLHETRPRELRDAQQQHFEAYHSLFSSTEGREVLARIEQFNTSLPQDHSNREALEEWNTEVRAWLATIQNPQLQEVIRFRPNHGVYTSMPPFVNNLT